MLLFLRQMKVAEIEGIQDQMSCLEGFLRSSTATECYVDLAVLDEVTEDATHDLIWS